MYDDTRTADWERRAELPLAAAWLLFLSSYATRVLARDLPPAWHDFFLAVLLLSWAVFVVEYAARWWLSGRLLGFVRTHVLDAVVVVLPLLRPVRFVRTYENLRRNRGEARLSLHARLITYTLVATGLLGFVGALAVYQQEHSAPNAEIRTFGDAVWWTCATLSTVGYGDVTPVTARGRLVAVGVMACGLGLLGAVTGTFSSWLLQVFAEEEQPPVNGGPPQG